MLKVNQNVYFNGSVVDCYVGQLRSGKTYHAVCVMLRHLGAGGLVVSNIRLDERATKAFCLEEYGVSIEWLRQYQYLTESWVTEFWRWVPKGETVSGTDASVLLVIDETTRFFTHKHMTQAAEECMALLQQAGKFGIHIIFCFPAFKRIAPVIREITQWVFVHKDYATMNVPVFGFLAGRMVNGVQVQRFGPDSKTEQIGKPVSLRKDARVFRCYDSFEAPVAVGFDESGVFKLRDLDRRGKPRRSRRWVRYGIAAGLVAVGFGSGCGIRDKISEVDELRREIAELRVALRGSPAVVAPGVAFVATNRVQAGRRGEVKSGVDSVGSSGLLDSNAVCLVVGSATVDGKWVHYAASGDRYGVGDDYQDNVIVGTAQHWLVCRRVCDGVLVPIRVRFERVHSSRASGDRAFLVGGSGPSNQAVLAGAEM